jgi:hypothetical protein
MALAVCGKMADNQNAGAREQAAGPIMTTAEQAQTPVLPALLFDFTSASAKIETGVNPLMSA